MRMFLRLEWIAAPTDCLWVSAWCSANSWNVGDSLSLRRMSTATMMSAKPSRKGTRHHHVVVRSGCAIWGSANVPAPSSVPIWMPTKGSAAKKPRRGGGANSLMSTVAPACSAPAPRPCRMRRATSRIGAMIPAVAWVGSRPMSMLDPPMRAIVTMRMSLRP